MPSGQSCGLPIGLKDFPPVNMARRENINSEPYNAYLSQSESSCIRRHRFVSYAKTRFLIGSPSVNMSTSNLFYRSNPLWVILKMSNPIFHRLYQ